MKTKLSILLLFFCMVIFAQRKTIAELYKTNSFEAAIFPIENDSSFPTPDFTPSRSEVDLAEKALIKDLKNLNHSLINQSNTPIIHKNLKKYCRQYSGYINKDGDRILLINCFWKSNKEVYKNFLYIYIYILDGGSFYWNVKYNIETGKLYDLNINGEG